MKKYVLRWPETTDRYARFLTQDPPMKALQVPMEEATVFEDIDWAVLFALMVDMKDTARSWKGCIVEYTR